MDETSVEWELLRQLVRARMLLTFAHKQPLYEYKADMDKAICKALGVDYYETSVEKYQKILEEVLNDDKKTL